jgi:hypothetical protein
MAETTNPHAVTDAATLISRINAQLTPSEPLKLDDFVIEELPPLPLALEQGDPICTSEPT